MNIQLIQGQFDRKEAIDIVTQMIHIKIKYHETKITLNSLEEDIKNREIKIKKLQKDLHEVRSMMLSKTESLQLTAAITID